MTKTRRAKKRPRATLPSLLSISQCATFLKWSYSKVYRLVRNGKIHSVEFERGAKLTDWKVPLWVARKVKEREKVRGLARRKEGRK